MPVPFLDLQTQFQSMEGEIRSAIDRVLRTQRFVLGEEVTAFEEEFSAYLGGSDAVGVASGTDALLLALLALNIGEGDEVITTPYSFFATASAIHRVGARPIFVDIDPGSFLIQVHSIADAVTPRTRAILPVHLFGQLVDMTPILEVASRKGLHVVEDSAQAIGSHQEIQGRKALAGTQGDLGCFSFYPTKNLGGAGDGGLVTARNPALTASLRCLRQHGEDQRYRHARVGLNSRLDSLQAAILRAKLPHLDEWIRLRERAASRYVELFEEAGMSGADGPVILPETRRGFRHTFQEFVIRAEGRDELRRHLQGAGIGCAIYYPIPLHLQPCFSGLGHHVGDFPVSETASATTLALPLYPELTPEAQNEVVTSIRRFYSK